VVVKKSIMLDHLPTNFDVAFRRARETLMMEGANKFPTEPEGVLNPVPSEGKGNTSLDDRVQEAHQDEQLPQPALQQGNTEHPIWDEVAKLGLKGTTDRTGGEGKVIGNEAAR
jgi:hypothetical protein